MKHKKNDLQRKSTFFPQPKPCLQKEKREREDMTKQLIKIISNKNSKKKRGKW